MPACMVSQGITPSVQRLVWASQTCSLAAITAASRVCERWLLRRESQARVQAARVSAGTMEVGTWGALHNWRTWALAAISMLEAIVKNAILYWCPLIIHSLARLDPASVLQKHRKNFTPFWRP